METPQHITLDLIDCDNMKIRNAIEIKRYVYYICDQLDLNRLDGPIIKYFEDPKDPKRSGVTAMQILQESSLDIHTYGESDICYISIFSCKQFNTLKFINKSMVFFDAKDCHINIVNRLKISSK